MSLPKPALPTYELDLPSNGKKIKYRPFVVREEKILLLAMESEDEDQIKNAIKDILSACIISRVKVEDLASFDLEYLFLRIRGASVGEDIKLKVTCLDDNETQVEVTLNVLDIEVYKPENHTNKIMLTDDLGIVMKYPKMNEFVNYTLLEKDLNSSEEVVELVANSIDQIFQEDEVWDGDSTPLKEKIDFVESLTQPQFEKIREFFETMPVLKHEFSVINPNTEVKSNYKLEGLQSFFG
jgi:hypothetical protein